MEPRAAEAWNLLLGDPGAQRVIPTGLGERTQLGRMGQGGRMQARKESYILTHQADVLNFTFPFIYFCFLNPVSLPEAFNLLFNIGLCD